ASVSTNTVVEDMTTVLTITSCKDDKCSTTSSTALISMATVTSSGKVTSYTTYCPLTATSTLSTSLSASSQTIPQMTSQAGTLAMSTSST
ncbi:hypothetical protein PACTADRAFT_29883, partial [Pachysolen tannophilus NRRL Y-2460]